MISLSVQRKLLYYSCTIVRAVFPNVYEFSLISLVIGTTSTPKAAIEKENLFPVKDVPGQ